MENSYDIAIIGGGIIGLATARALGERAPRARLVILEKEAKLATHQTGNNSGVIHSGIYYKPGSYKAKLCVEGKGLMLDFCSKHGIRVDHVGKVIVATEPAELPRLQTLYERGVANGVPVEMIEPGQLREIEPHASALRAIRSPSTAIVDYKEVCAAMTRELTARGVAIETGAGVTSIRRDRARHAARRRAHHADRELRRPLFGHGRAHGGREGRCAHHPVPRRVLHDPAGAPGHRPGTHLSGPRSRVPVP